MAARGDLRTIAEFVHVHASGEELARLAPLLEALAGDLERLHALPLGDVEPAFVPRLSPREPGEP
jgi:Asp-tRNA(Asn)/Glu-tRNA(Gln) amidotransferase C subunit